MEPPSVSEVSECISLLKRHRAAGPDDLPPALFKDGGGFFTQCLSSLFGFIWEKETVLDKPYGCTAVKNEFGRLYSRIKPRGGEMSHSLECEFTDRKGWATWQYPSPHASFRWYGTERLLQLNDKTQGRVTESKYRPADGRRNMKYGDHFTGTVTVFGLPPVDLPCYGTFSYLPHLPESSVNETVTATTGVRQDTLHSHKVTSAGEMAPDTLTVAQIQLKARIGDLSSRKASLEKEIQTFSEVLEANGNVGLHAPLVDREGFPRSDIDLVAVRVARNNIIRLNNDHKQVMNELEGCLHHLHELARQAGPTSQTEVKEEPKIQSTTTAKAPQLRAFLVVEEVQPGGVAESVGLEVGDRITQFGSVSAENFETLRDISTVMHNTPANIPILLTVIKPSKDNSSYELELKKPSGGVSLGMRVKPL
ncbi:hypothetical protein T265_00546 [Opisthorchis viverrini]|uniref:26S proteasome non-ATPase regulatory subunit 9 n=1 Tax=Opisthorchis viverrini TaxID=6198 RepID=A0A075ACM6_OPIVI|nr:hypothetical protein T265_00546 [Opisthorchis viverrini]KER33660.1 hypothetical protein T265_00546 [Opisthorchis viverrini]